MHIKYPNIFTFISEFKKEKIYSLDKNIAVIFRNYQKKHSRDDILKIKKFCKSNKKKFFLANDIKLAAKLNLDGVYVPSFNNSLSIKKYNLKKNFLIIGSAHNLKEIRIKEKQGVKLIFLSPLFKTKDYKKSLGIIRFNLLSRLCKKKIIALGGINKNNLKKLKIANAYGFSGISYFK